MDYENYFCFSFAFGGGDECYDVIEERHENETDDERTDRIFNDYDYLTEAEKKEILDSYSDFWCCANCDFWYTETPPKKNNDLDIVSWVGQCRRKPPVKGKDGVVFARPKWQYTNWNNWCGDCMSDTESLKNTINME